MTTAERSRRTDILELLTAGDPGTPLVVRVCEVSAQLLGISGAGMCLVGGRQHQIIVHGTDALIEELEDLQATLGAGPCVEAIRTGLPVLIPELAEHHSEVGRAYVSHALSSGVRAVFSFPLQSGDIQLGTLDLYRHTAGPLDELQTADAWVLTEIATRSMLAQQDKIYLDGTVSALHWLTVEDESIRTGHGRAADLGISVEQALAPPWPDGGHEAVDPQRDPG
jgi:hypothetical protein